MPTRYVLRVQIRPDRGSAETARRVVRIARDCRADEVMMFAFCEEYNDGHPPLAAIDGWLERTRPARALLRGAGIAVSINPWQTLLHSDRGRRLRGDQRWQTMVDPLGHAARAVVCPLDPGWRRYAMEALARYAAEAHVTAVWVEDDIRLHHHAPLVWGGCFCPLHLREFARRSGVTATREQIVAAATAPGDPHPWRREWLVMWDDTQLDLIRSWRRIVEGHGVRLGLMSSGLAAHGAEGRDWGRWFDALSSSGAPLHRPHYFSYGSVTPGMFAPAVTDLDRNRAIQPPAVISYPEVENAPYGRWQKSFREQFAQMALAQVLGSSGLALSVHDSMDNEPGDEPERARFLVRAKPALDWLADRFPMTMSTAGIGIAWSDAVAARVPLTPAAGRWESLVVPSGGFGAWWMAAGLAVTFRTQQRVMAITAPAVWAASDSQLRGWLAGSALLDGPALVALHQRGYGELCGIESPSLVDRDDLTYSVEIARDPRFALRPDARLSLNRDGASGFCSRLAQGRPVPAATVATVIGDPDARPIGHGLVLFRNRRGGRIATVPWDAESVPVMNEQRAAHLLGLARWLGAETLVAGGHPWLIPVLLTDESHWSAAIWNVSPDDVHRIRVRLPARLEAPTEIVHVRANGRRGAAELRAGVLSVREPLRQWDCVVLVGRTAGGVPPPME